MPFDFSPSPEEEARRARIADWLGCGFWAVVVGGACGVAYLSRYRHSDPPLFFGAAIALAAFFLIVQVVSAVRRRF